MKHYFKIWLRLTLSSFQIAFTSRFGAFIFILAKLLRFSFFMLVVFLVIGKTNSLAGYTLTQSVIFFLTYNVIDSVTQLLFREVYRAREKVVSGDFDLILIKPMNALFRPLLGGADPLDLFVIVPYLILLTIFLASASVTLSGLVEYLILCLNAFVIAAAFHIAVLALGIITTEIDHTIMIYRDVTSMARFPVDIYREPLKGFITFVIPVGIMMTFPPKALFGLLNPLVILFSCVLGLLCLLLAYKAWQYALTQYTSASS